MKKWSFIQSLKSFMQQAINKKNSPKSIDKSIGNTDKRLTIELVPATAWYKNVRSEVTKEKWDYIRKKCYRKANHKCEVCSDNGKNQGYKHTVECHEIWEYDDEKHTQTLAGFIALCPFCHKVKHPGLAQINGEMDIVLSQLMKVNSITEEQARKYLTECFEIWEERSKHKWSLCTASLLSY